MTMMMTMTMIKGISYKNDGTSEHCHEKRDNDDNKQGHDYQCDDLDQVKEKCRVNKDISEEADLSFTIRKRRNV